MTAKTKELDFEEAIEHHLLTAGGWAKGSPKDFDRQTAIAAGDFFAFVEATQRETWTELRKHHGRASRRQSSRARQDARRARHARRPPSRVQVLRQEDRGRLLPACPRDEPDILARYGENRLVVTRQVRFSRTGISPSTSCCSSTASRRHRRAEEPAHQPDRRARHRAVPDDRDPDTRSSLQDAGARPLRRRSGPRRT